MNQSDIVNIDSLNSGIKAIRSLRHSATEFFKFLSEGVKADDEDKDKKFILQFQQNFSNINTKIRELESASTLLSASQTNTNLGNVGSINLDPTLEKHYTYTELVKAYKWVDKCHDFSLHASNVLSTNAIKRSYTFNGGKKMYKLPNSGHDTPTQNVDAVISTLQKIFPNMTIDVMRPFGVQTILKISLDKILTAVVVMRGLILEWVMVKSFIEDFYKEDDTLDLWSSSRHIAFRKITDHANSAILHYTRANNPEFAIKPFISWLHSYSNLFDAPCRGCNKRLKNYLPPTWREFRSLQVYHDTCRQ